MDAHKRKAAAIGKELSAVLRAEEKLRVSAKKKMPPAWKKQLEEKVPQKVYTGLEAAFSKAFSLMFSQGSKLVDKTCKKEAFQTEHKIRDYAFQLTGRRKDLKQLRKTAGHAQRTNLAITTAEGAGLGLVGIGIPDIALFIGTLLKGIYELSMSYGFPYDTRQEQMLILKIMEASLSTGEAWDSCNAEVDRMLRQNDSFTEAAWDAQINATASAFAVDMILLKFIQGIPIVGLVGGAANPVYYRRVMKYAELKYRKRYLWKQTTDL